MTTKKTSGIKKITSILLISALCLPLVFSCGFDGDIAIPLENITKNENLPGESEPAARKPVIKNEDIPSGAQSLFIDTFPFLRGETGRYNIGTLIYIDTDGVVSHLRAYVLEEQVGELKLKLFEYENHGELAAFTFESGDYGEGWEMFELEEPLAIHAGYYIVSLSGGYDREGNNLFAWSDETAEFTYPDGSMNITVIQGLHGTEGDIDKIPLNIWGEDKSSGADLIFFPDIG